MLRRLFESTRTFLTFAVPIAIVGAVVVYFFLRNPDSRIVRLIEGKVSSTDSRIMHGPYPAEKDLVILKHNGVTTIVNLMNPAVPYEKPLIEQERKSAEKYGLEFYNLPMNPVSAMMNREGAGANLKTAEKAVDIINKSKGKVYYHCYLGIHRVGVVAKMLEEKGVKSGKYLVREGDRTKRASNLDKSQAEFNAGNYEEVIKLLSSVKAHDPRESLLLAWSYYKLNKIDEAKGEFEDVLAADNGSADALNGHGYVMLRKGDAAAAGADFAAALKTDANDVSALTGLGIALYRQGKLPEAADTLEKALKLQPGNGDAKEVYDRIPAKYK